MSKIWIVGAASQLGQALRNSLKPEFDVVSFVRKSHEEALITGDFQVFLDLSETTGIKEKLRAVLNQSGTPDGIIFCHRYRPPQGCELESWSDFKQAVDVELGPIYILRELINELESEQPISIVAFNSVVSNSVNYDVPVNYHLVKAMTRSTINLFATLDAKLGVRWNTIILGEFLKYPKENYDLLHQKFLDAVERKSFNQRLCSLEDICKLVKFLMTSESSYITGNEFLLNGCLSHIGAEYLLRDEVARNED